jgi:hypothetical protein
LRERLARPTDRFQPQPRRHKHKREADYDSRSSQQKQKAVSALHAAALQYQHCGIEQIHDKKGRNKRNEQNSDCDEKENQTEQHQGK